MTLHFLGPSRVRAAAILEYGFMFVRSVPLTQCDDHEGKHLLS